MRRARAAVLAGVAGAAIVAGCTGGSDGSDSSPSASLSVSSLPPTTLSALPSSPAASTGSTPPTSASAGSSTPAPTASVAQPPDPVIGQGNQGAWTLTRAAPGQPEQQQVPALQCQPDGTVEADRLLLTAGGTQLTLVGATPAQSIGVTGTSTVDAAGGTFRGRSADTAVAFTWTC